MSFILDALRKSEHERQRSAVPGLTQVPAATASSEVPRWVLPVIGALAAGVLVLGGAWWQSTRGANDAGSAPAPTARTVELPQPPAQIAPTAVVPSAAPPRVPRAEATPPSAVASSAATRTTLEAAAADEPATPATSEPPLPSAASLMAEGVTLPPLRLDLHAYSERPSDRFVFINGRKYVEGERLPEGLVLVAIEPRGAVLSHLGRRFLLVPE